MYRTVNVLAVSSLVATALAWMFLRLVSVRATPLAVVVHGALINAARLALEASAEPPINTFHGAVPIGDTNVNVTPCIVTVSLAVGLVAKANTADPVTLLDV